MTTPRDPGDHVSGSLPALLNETLSTVEMASTNAHLAMCSACRHELAEWEAITAASSLLVSTEPPSQVPTAVWAAITNAPLVSQPTRSPSWLASLAWQLLVGQLSLVRRAIWIASAVTMMVGCLIAVLLSSMVESGLVLAMVAPLVAAIGVAFIYGPENDEGLELSLATLTPPYLVLAARLTLVYGFDLVGAVLATLVLAAQGGSGFLPLISLWLGPMLFLSALTLMLSLLWGSAVAIVTAMGLWLLRLVMALDSGRSLDLGVFTELGRAFWQRTPLLLALSALLLMLALTYVPRQERFSL